MACLDENEVVALVNGRLSGERLLSAQQHLDACEECLDVVGLFQQATGPSDVGGNGARANAEAEFVVENQFIPLSESEEINLNAQPGTSIGRYEVIRPIGRGGMGVVYLARDPELDRMVAIKLVKPSLKSDERVEHFERRLMREARAMAKLTHPNVLTIYDVGIRDGQVFLASEWIDGSTLEEWICENTHRVLPLVAKFCDAARGLVAAHQAGLIHRDFKPSNVMVGKDGRVLVFDFGLVKSMTPSMGEITTQLSGKFIVGTPAYMAPEQMIGDPADERSDQFSFCASLYESIAGKRPFAGRSLLELLANIKAGKIEEPKHAPKWLWDMLKRGLRRKPDERFESMAMVLEILETGLANRRRRSLLIGVGVTTTMASVLVGAFFLRPDAESGQVACLEESIQVGEAWDSSRRSAVKEGILSSEAEYAKDAWEYVSTYLDAYSTGWKKQAKNSCQETRYGNSLQNDGLFARRSTCLSRLQVQLNSVTTRLQVGDIESVRSAVAIVQELAPLSTCKTVRVLQDGSTPIAAENLEEQRKLWAQSKTIDTLLSTGNYQEAQLRTEALLEHSIGHRPTEARLSARRGLSLRNQGRYTAAVVALEKAFYAAVAGRDDEVAARTTCEIFEIYATELDDESASFRWSQLAEAAVERDRSPGVLATWRRSQGNVARQKGLYDVSESHFQASLEILLKEFGEHDFQVADTLQALGSLYLQRQSAAEAQRVYQQLVALREATVGTHHPEVAEAQSRLASALYLGGNTSEAQTMGENALSLLISSYGENHFEVSQTLNTLAKFAVDIGDFELANQYLLRALKIKKVVNGEQSPMLVSTLTNLMEVDRMRLRPGDRVIHGIDALEILREKDPMTAAAEARMERVKLGIAEARIAGGDARSALRECQAMQDALTPDVMPNGRIASCLGRSQLFLAKNSSARKQATETLRKSISEFSGAGGVHAAVAQFALAIALVGPNATRLEAVGARAEAIVLAQQAQVIFAEAGPAWKHSRDKVQSWLSSYGI